MFTFEQENQLSSSLLENFTFYGIEENEEINLEEAKADFKLFIESCEDENELEEGFKEFKEKVKSKFKKKKKGEEESPEEDEALEEGFKEFKEKVKSKFKKKKSEDQSEESEEALEEALEEGFKEFKEKVKSKFTKKKKGEEESEESDDDEAAKCESLAEACDLVLTEANIVRFDKETLKKRLLSRSTLIMAKESGDPLYDKWKLHAEKKSTYRKEISRKYEGKAKRKVREYLAARKAKKTGTSAQ